jgi:MoxR-like ATPase
MSKKIKPIDDTTKLEAADYEWPDHVVQVTTEGWGVLSMSELRIILAMLGKDPDVQPKDKSDVIGDIENLSTDDTVRSQAIYEMVCKHKVPKGDKPLPSGGCWTSSDFHTEVTKLIERVKKDLSTEAVDQLVVASMTEAQALIEQHIEKALEKVRKIEVQLPDDKKSIKLEGVTHEKFELILQLISQRAAVLLVGPTQSGKTTIAKQIAKALKLRFAAQSFSGGLTESKLFGRVLPGKGGSAEFVGTPFLDMYENGGLYLADELDAADSNVMTAWNMWIANGEGWLAERAGREHVKMHKDFRIIAAANTFGFGSDARYVGRNALDYATLERFGCGVVYMDYDRRIESALARKEILDWAWRLRDRIRSVQLNREMSTRTIAVMETMTKAYNWNTAQWEERFFANWTAEEKRLLRL